MLSLCCGLRRGKRLQTDVTRKSCQPLSPAISLQPIRDSVLAQHGKVAMEIFKLCIQLVESILTVYAKNCCQASCCWLLCSNDVKYLKIEASTFRTVQCMLELCAGCRTTLCLKIAFSHRYTLIKLKLVGILT